MFTSHPTICLRGLCSPDALAASDDHRRRDFCFSGTWQHAAIGRGYSFSRNDGFMTALIRSRISGMRQTGEDQFGASWTARGRGVEAGAYLPPRLSTRGSCEFKQHPTIEKTGAGVVMRGRTL
jgi:hypothetical protein